MSYRKKHEPPKPEQRELYPVIVSFWDGKFSVVDGQNRIATMRQMAGDDDVIVPCMVYTGMTMSRRQSCTPS